MPLPHRCSVCNTIHTSHGPRCPIHERAYQQRRNASREHYRGDYKTARAQLRLQAEANQHPCAICLEPIDYTLNYPHPLSFSADHIHAGDATSPLRATHLRCNVSRGRGDPRFSQ